MPLFTITPDSKNVHHHSLLAGLGAGGVAVLAAFGLVLMAWHRVSGAIGNAVITIVWAVAAAVIIGVIAASVYAVLWLRHRARHPASLGAVTPAPLTAAVAAPAVHYHLDSPEAAAVVLQAMADRPQITGGRP